jgi:uncharacterized protein YcaQ
MSGDVMVVGHDGPQNIWGLADRFLPDWVDRTELTEEEAARRSAERAVRALGTATPREVQLYFPRGRYRDPQRALAQLERDARLRRVRIEGLDAREERYIHVDDLDTLESLRADDWEPRLSLVPPFDNLLPQGDRTRRLFGFDYVREQFLPAEKRRFGTYVLPIVWGERFIGRIDPRLDKKSRTLFVQAVHAEAGAPRDREVAERIHDTIADLGEFVGAQRVTYTSRVPAAWRSALR